MQESGDRLARQTAEAQRLIDRDELRGWLRLLLAPGIGRDGARRLLAALGLPQAVFDAGRGALEAVGGSAFADALEREPAGLERRVDDTLAWLGGGEARALVTLGDPRYPVPLLHTADPPLLLFVQGRAELLGAPAIAVVGSRNPSPQGEANARAFARHFSRHGYTVVSGLALGIDGAAHEGGLDGSGSTIAVVGTGLDRVYPGRHRDLAHRIAIHGLLVSEYPLGTPPLAPNFPLRNRIIAGLSVGTLVVEAALQSGSLITARLAAEAGREVFALPGSIHSPQSRGCHALIKQGAKLVDGAEDVLEELRPVAPAGPVRQRDGAASRPRAGRPGAAGEGPAQGTPDADGGDGDPVLAALGHDPATLDTLLARTGWPAPRLNARLLELELDGRVARLPGGLFQRRVST